MHAVGSMNSNRRKPTEHEERIDVLRVMPDYEYMPDVFEERDPRAVALLKIINSALTEDERRLLILYAECRSNYSRASRQLGVSPPTVAVRIKAIRAKIIKIYGKYGNDEYNN